MTPNDRQELGWIRFRMRQLVSARFIEPFSTAEQREYNELKGAEAALLKAAA